MTTTARGYGYRWQQLRLVILWRDGWRCHWCGRRANSVDHVIAKVEGGSDDPSNLVAACTPCNSRRSIELVNARNRRGKRRPGIRGAFFSGGTGPEMTSANRSHIGGRSAKGERSGAIRL